MPDPVFLNQARAHKDFVSENLEEWRALDRAVARRDLFWIFYHAHQLSTAWCLYEAKRVIAY